ncbi:disease resistance protein RFL1-like [Abrus precatorius]|uniref:Disease resistance protein RFL1-like n=1 Tax=Abrus precatorius TaxID=3816 RepID=A0A8B8L7W8_ABRPR|nr:disease resistance protein RFL1-like [Abrus precatorius]
MFLCLNFNEAASASNQAVNEVPFISQINELNQFVSDRTHNNEADILEQLQRLESHGKKRNRKVDYWLNELHNLTNSVKDTHKKQKPLDLSNEFISNGFEKNVSKMWELLRDDKVLVIGVHGMGRVGKTLLATYMESEIKKKSFNDVFWISVSQECSISKLQHDIAKKIRVKLDDEDDEKQEQQIYAKKVGIPLGVIGIKLIVTSRLKNLCQQMDCLLDNMIRVDPLSYTEAMKLFLLKLGQCIVKRCYGLPLEISKKAVSMKGRDHVRWWDHELKKIRKMKIREEILNVLKLSYDNLVKKKMQNCFLHCALLPNDIEKREVIMKLVEGGVLNGKRSLEEIFKEGHIILDNLIDHSMLMNSAEYDWEDEDYYIAMNGLLRKMASHLLKERGSYTVKCDEELEKIPDMLEWKVDFGTVQLPGICLGNALSLSPHPLSSLDTIVIENCTGLENLFCLSDFCCGPVWLNGGRDFKNKLVNFKSLMLELSSLLLTANISFIELQSLTFIICKLCFVGVAENLV